MGLAPFLNLQLRAIEAAKLEDIEHRLEKVERITNELLSNPNDDLR